MPAIFISNQEAREIIEALESLLIHFDYEYWLGIEYDLSTRKRIEGDRAEDAKKQLKKYSRLLTDIKRRIK
jgi:hypothetical protein